ncbi:MAG: precorrin-6y C5,15-methyltransferase (decarboxylating) subunit CbiE [Clostridiales bacterium]|nr:precorrin-6y C5,15-methyltransferase (decarboxylating) subunit CbiE [Clostridiales bacterium]
MKKVAVVGVGLGQHTLTPEARDAISQAGVLLGAANVLEAYQEKRSHPYYLPKDVAACIEREDAETFAVLVSGDVGFYSAATGICAALSAYELRFIPGISTVNAFFARLKLPWQDAAFISAHGRGANVVDTVRRSRLTLCLTGNNTDAIGEALCKAGFGGIKVHVGENIGAEQERIHETTAEELSRGVFPSLTVLLFVNEAFDDRTPHGLSDDSFSRLPGIPMTKSETRAVVLSKLNLHPNCVCWDVGAGTGSVTVEMALSVYRGHVYAVERREDAIPLIEQNCAAFHLGNVTLVRGEAPAALEMLPSPDAVFIGGSGGETGEIIAAVLRKNQGARIVVTAVTIETVSAALSAFHDRGLDPEILQINVAKGIQAGALHIMEAQNPITFLSVGGKPCAVS